jgi:protein-L-isoaspartate(D-aspartate) O-methyltransferase
LEVPLDTSRLDERQAMVKEQLVKRGIRHPRVLQAMLDVPRHLFVPPASQNKAYEDGPLPIESNQTISQPYIVASMIELIEPQPVFRVLEVGVGSGYSTAVLSRLVSEVYGVERDELLLSGAEKKFQEIELSNIQIKLGDGTLGWEKAAPFDAILVTAGSPRVPAPLLDQLKVGGVLMIPVGNRAEQNLTWVVKRSPDHFQEKTLYPVRFVPLIGKEGWSGAV